MLKPQDCMLLLKLLAQQDNTRSQRELAQLLGISLSEVNAGIRRLVEAGLLRKNKQSQLIPILNAAEEFLIGGLKYMIPAKLGEYTRGMPTAYAAPLFHDLIALGDDPVPVWPDAQGEKKGVALLPIYSSVTKSLHRHFDQEFYDLLVLVDVIRVGKARERNMAIKILKDRLKHENQ